MKKIIILLLLTMISCSKKRNINTPYIPNSWDYGNNFYNYNRYNPRVFPTNVGRGSWPSLRPYWTTYNRYSFYYTRYNCAGYNLSFCNYQTVGQGGKEFFNVFSKISAENRHPFGNTYGQVLAGIQMLFTPRGAGIAPTFIKIGRAQNGLSYWLYQSADGRTRFGINPAFPIWANPVFLEEKIGNATIGYYLSYWMFY